jgi:prevent-host-death family protein
MLIDFVTTILENETTMKYVGIRQLKAQLGRYLREVEAGDTLTLTSHKRPIARLVPVSKKSGNIEEILTALTENGLLRRARRKPSPIRHPINIPDVRIAEAVLEDRGALL